MWWFILILEPRIIDERNLWAWLWWACTTMRTKKTFQDLKLSSWWHKRGDLVWVRVWRPIWFPPEDKEAELLPAHLPFLIQVVTRLDEDHSLWGGLCYPAHWVLIQVPISFRALLPFMPSMSVSRGLVSFVPQVDAQGWGDKSGVSACPAVSRIHVKEAQCVCVWGGAYVCNPCAEEGAGRSLDLLTSQPSWVGKLQTKEETLSEKQCE